MWKDRINGRAKRAVYDQPLPLLLSSMQGHIGTVSSLQYVPNARIIVRYVVKYHVRACWGLKPNFLISVEARIIQFGCGPLAGDTYQPLGLLDLGQ